MVRSDAVTCAHALARRRIGGGYCSTSEPTPTPWPLDRPLARPASPLVVMPDQREVAGAKLSARKDPSIEVVLGVSLQQARQALESLDQEALGALGMGSGTDAPPLPMRPMPKKPTIRAVMNKDRLRMTPAAKKVLEEAVKPNRRKNPGHGPASAGTDPHSPTTRSCGGAAGRSRREHVGGSAPIGTCMTGRP
jgi:hypothetical protein